MSAMNDARRAAARAAAKVAKLRVRAAKLAEEIAAAEHNAIFAMRCAGLDHVTTAEGLVSLLPETQVTAVLDRDRAINILVSSGHSVPMKMRPGLPARIRFERKKG